MASMDRKAPRMVTPYEPLVNMELAQPKEHGTSWFSTASLIIANMLGAGVLGLPSAAKKMGWWGFGVMMVLSTFMSVYAGLILGWLRGADSSLRSYSDLSEKVASVYSVMVQKVTRYSIRSIAYAYIFGSCTIYLITMKISLMSMLQRCDDLPPISNDSARYDCTNTGCSDHGVTSFKETIWLLITAAIAYPLLHFRSLSEISFVAYFGVGTIGIVNCVIIGRGIYDTTHHGSAAQHYEFDLKDFINGFTQIAFAYGGHCLMVEMISEMKRPLDFHNSIYLSQAFMFVNYATVGFLGYYVYGDNVLAPITLNLPDDKLRLATNALLFVHVLVAYCINSCVLCQFFCEMFWPGLISSQEPSGSVVLHRSLARAKFIRWGLVSTSVLILCILIAVVIPFFSDLMNIYSSIGIFTLSFSIPPLMYVVARSPMMSEAAKITNMTLCVLALIGCGFGVWAAIDDISQKWAHCHYKIEF